MEVKPVRLLCDAKGMQHVLLNRYLYSNLHYTKKNTTPYPEQLILSRHNSRLVHHGTDVIIAAE